LIRRERLDLILVIAVAAVANFVYLVASNGDFFYPDSFTYLKPAANLLHGLGLVDARGAAETLRTPGYPLLLALFGTHVLPVIVLQHMLNVALAAGIYLFVFQRLGNRSGALTASILFAIDTPTIHYANKILSETVFTAMLAVVFVLALRRSMLPLIGLLCGVLVLVRPIAIGYFAVLALYFVLCVDRLQPARDRLKPVLHLALFALALPMGWAVRNWYHTGVFTVSSIGGINMLTYRAAGALAIEDGGDFHADITDEQNGLSEDADDEIQQSLHVPDAQELSNAVRSQYYARFAWRVVSQHPFAFVQLGVRGLLINFFDSDWDAMAIVSPLHPSTIETTVGALPIIVFVFSVIGVLALWRSDRPLALLIALTVVYFLGISAGGEAEARFRVPVMPQMVIAAAAGVEAVRRGISASAAASPR
jgi:hypothetical protein